MRFFIIFSLVLSAVNSCFLHAQNLLCKDEFSSFFQPGANQNGSALKKPSNSAPSKPQIPANTPSNISVEIEKLKLFLQERLPAKKVKDILSRAVNLKSMNVENLKKRVFFLDEHIGKDQVNEQLSRSLIGFLSGDVRQMRAATALLDHYIGRSGTLSLMRKNNAYFSFFHINPNHHQPILKILEHYLSTDEIRNIIMENSKKFSLLRPHFFNGNIDFLKQTLSAEEISALLKTKENFYSLFELDSSRLVKIKKILEPLLGEKDFLFLLKNELALFNRTHPHSISSVIDFLKEVFFKAPEIKALLLENPSSFLSINFYDLKQIIHAVKKYYGLEKTINLLKTYFYQIAKAQWKKVSLSPIKNFIDSLIPPPHIILEHFKFQSGQIRFAEKYFNGSMLNAYSFVKQSIPPFHFVELQWREFKGTTKRYLRLKASLLDKKNKIKNIYRGIEGQKKFARDHFYSFMDQAFFFASNVIDTAFLNRLNWRIFMGTVEDFENLPLLVFDENGRFKYKNKSGMLQAADTLYQGNLQKTYTNVSAVVEKSYFQELGWKLFSGTSQDYRKTKNRLIQPDGSVSPRYISLNGQSLYAKKYTDHYLLKAYLQARFVLEPEVFSQLGWKSIAIRSEELKKLYQKIFDQKGNLASEYLSESGYLDIADEFFNGSLRKTYEVIEALMDRKKFLNLRWRKFYGYTYQYRDLINILVDEMGRVNTIYLGIKGLYLFAARHTKGSLANAYTNASIVLPARLFQQLNWHYFNGNLTQANEILTRLMEVNGQVRPEYRLLNGYKKFSDEFFKGNMEASFKKTSALLSPSQKQERGWRIFRGSTAQLTALFNDFKQNYPDLWRGQENLKRLARFIFPEKSLLLVFNNARAVRDDLFLSEKTDVEEQFKQLNWQRKTNWEHLREQFQFEVSEENLMEMKKIFEFLTAYANGAKMPIKFKRGFARLLSPNLKGIVLVVQTLESYAGKETAVERVKENLESILNIHAEQWLEMIRFLEKTVGKEHLSDKLSAPSGKILFLYDPSFLKRNAQTIAKYTDEAFISIRLKAFDPVLFKTDPKELALNAAFIAEVIGRAKTAQKIKQNLRGLSKLKNQKLLNLENQRGRRWMLESLFNLTFSNPVFQE